MKQANNKEITSTSKQQHATNTKQVCTTSKKHKTYKQKTQNNMQLQAKTPKLSSNKLAMYTSDPKVLLLQVNSMMV